MSLFLSRIVNIAIALFSLKDIDFERSIKKRKPRHAFAHYTGLWNRREIHECYNYKMNGIHLLISMWITVHFN